MPTGLIWLGLMLATLLCWKRKQRLLSFYLFLLTALYTLAGNPQVGCALLRSLESRIPPVDIATLEPFDAVCVLGGGSELDPRGTPELGPSGDRIFAAAKLWHAGKARILVTSGVSQDEFNGVQRNAGQETRVLWRSLGIPESAIRVVPDPCWVTGDEIKAYCKLRDQYGWKRIALVSSAWHLPRALALADREGLHVTPIGADWQSRQRAHLLRECVPQGPGFLNTQLGCWEYLGQAVDRWKKR